MQTKNNLVRKIMSAASGLALLVSLEGCGTAIQHLDEKTDVWYDCNTNTNYPSGHPCYSVVTEYNAVHGSSSSSNSPDYCKPRCPGCGCDSGRTDAGHLGPEK